MGVGDLINNNNNKNIQNYKNLVNVIGSRDNVMLLQNLSEKKIEELKYNMYVLCVCIPWY